MNGISNIIAMLPKFLEIDKIKNMHNKMKEEIFDRISEFKQENKNLDLSRLIVIGSSCFIYQDYLLKGSLNDVDIYLDKISKKEITITKGMDIIGGDNKNFFIAEDFRSRLIKTDGINFLSKEDLIVNMISSLVKATKLNTNSYLELLIIDADKELIKTLLESAFLNAKKNCTKEYLERINSAVKYFENTYTDEFISSRIGCQDNFFRQLKEDINFN